MTEAGEEKRSRLDRLRAHVSDLEIEMSNASGSAFAALSGRYLEAIRQLDEIEGSAPAAGSPADELAAKRKSRRKPINKGRRAEPS